MKEKTQFMKDCDKIEEIIQDNLGKLIDVGKIVSQALMDMPVGEGWWEDRNNEFIWQMKDNGIGRLSILSPVLPVIVVFEIRRKEKVIEK